MAHYSEDNQHSDGRDSEASYTPKNKSTEHTSKEVGEGLTESEKIIQSVTENELREYSNKKSLEEWRPESEPTYNPGADAWQIAILQKEKSGEIIPAFAFGKTIDECMERASLVASAPTLHADNKALRKENEELIAALKEWVRVINRSEASAPYYQSITEKSEAIINRLNK